MWNIGKMGAFYYIRVQFFDATSISVTSISFTSVVLLFSRATSAVAAHKTPPNPRHLRLPPHALSRGARCPPHARGASRHTRTAARSTRTYLPLRSIVAPAHAFDTTHIRLSLPHTALVPSVIAAPPRTTSTRRRTRRRRPPSNTPRAFRAAQCGPKIRSRAPRGTLHGCEGSASEAPPRPP